MHLSPPVAKAPVGSKVVVLLLLIRCWVLLPLWDSVIVLCFVVRYFLSILILQSSWWGRESWLHCLVCLPSVSWLLCGSFSWCHGSVCSLWLWYYLIILTNYVWSPLSELHKFCAFANPESRVTIWSVKLSHIMRFQQCGMCDQQSLRSACPYAHSDHSLC